MFGGTFALSCLAVDTCTTLQVPQGGRGQHEVDAHAFALGEGQALVVPVGVHTGSGGVVACDVLEARLGERGEGCTLGFGDVGRPFEGGHVPHVVILRGNVEITDVGDLRVGVG